MSEPTDGLLQSQADFVSALDDLSHSEVLALDTEFMREQSYYPKLCLVQLADARQQVCIDPLRLADLNPLAVRLVDWRQIKVIHSAAQDLEVLHQRLGCLPSPLFDTQLAATFCGMGEQLGYAALIEQVLGVVLDKSASRTDWAQRPLSVQQLHYAREDVRYLPALHAHLEARLQDLGRATWLAEDCAVLLASSHWTIEPDEAWRKVKGWQRAPKSGFARLCQLAAWRERQAQHDDRPRRWILDDETLLHLVQRPPHSVKALLHLLPAHLAPHAEVLLDVLTEAVTEVAAPPAWQPLPATARERLKRLQEVLEKQAKQLNLPASLLLNRAMLERIARRAEAVETLQGWRAEVLGEVLRQAL